MTSLYTVNVQTFSTLIKCYYNYKDPHSYRDRIKKMEQKFEILSHLILKNHSPFLFVKVIVVCILFEWK